MEEDLIRKKAELALGGGILLPEGFELPTRVSHSTAGPGAGSDSAAFSFYGMRVKKSISYEKGEFELRVREDGSLYLTRGGEPFIDEIAFEPVVYHCPGQAFFTLDSRCGYRCAFCASPRLPSTDPKLPTDEEIVEKSVAAHKKHGITAVSLTSGVFNCDVEAEVDRFISCIKAVRNALPDMPIGIEPYVTTEDQVRRLKEAGATDIKINIQTATEELGKKVCPDFDRSTVLDCIRHAVKYFGGEHVTSNLIFGFGESDEEVEACMREICELGAIPTVRSLRYNNYNRESLAAAVGNPARVDAERMLKIAKIHKAVLMEYGMDTVGFKTMCIECGCCDIVPFRDL